MNAEVEESKRSDVVILFKIPQEQIADIELSFPLTATIEDVKREISQKHSLKPAPQKQKLFFAGRMLATPTDTLSDILAGVSLSTQISRKTSKTSKSFISRSTARCRHRLLCSSLLRLAGRRSLEGPRPRRR
jgi:hypothetical protein